MKTYGDKITTWPLLLVELFFLYFISPTTAWTAAAVPPADHESIMYALRQENFTSFANTIDNAIWHERFFIPPSATIFVPPNSIVDGVLSSNPNVTDLVSYHITNNNYYFSVLANFTIGTQISTLLANNTLLVTDNDPNSFYINNINVMARDLCTIQTVACYAISDILNSSIWGQVTLSDASPTASIPVAPPIPSLQDSSSIQTPTTSPIGSPLASAQSPSLLNDPLAPSHS
ncbi:hypothetical protein KC19_5G181200 [Ceratodon purpureus]|uniref:FAS1 domain-containing protein n=1 Tax=Ceratodon purpureus TaxID=3225 RepID=A0A8T0I5F6_CERPU|nr:hypothetical protein KC19_5G181200 [Ceratodon purpureus]